MVGSGRDGETRTAALWIPSAPRAVWTRGFGRDERRLSHWYELDHHTATAVSRPDSRSVGATTALVCRRGVARQAFGPVTAVTWVRIPEDGAAVFRPSRTLCVRSVPASAFSRRSTAGLVRVRLHRRGPWGEPTLTGSRGCPSRQAPSGRSSERSGGGPGRVSYLHGPMGRSRPLRRSKYAHAQTYRQTTISGSMVQRSTIRALVHETEVSIRFANRSPAKRSETVWLWFELPSERRALA